MGWLKKYCDSVEICAYTFMIVFKGLRMHLDIDSFTKSACLKADVLNFDLDKGEVNGLYSNVELIYLMMKHG